MNHFHNDQLGAPNVLEVGVDSGAGAEILAFYRSTSGRRHLQSHSPPWNSDVEWISARSLAAFAVFQREFDRLRLASHVRPFVDLDDDVRMYGGFLVKRSRCKAPDFHADWVDADNDAFTFLAPLTDNGGDFGLLYEKDDRSIGDYRYEVGKGLIFGDGFLHSTKPGQARDPVILLSFTFGTDKMKHWPKIAATAADQGALVRRPDGRLQSRAGAGLGTRTAVRLHNLARRVGLHR